MFTTAEALALHSLHLSAWRSSQELALGQPSSPPTHSPPYFPLGSYWLEVGINFYVFTADVYLPLRLKQQHLDMYFFLF